MTDLSDLDFYHDDAPAPNVGAAPRRKCRRHEWVTHREAEVGPWQTYTQCRRCQKRQDAAVSRRGRNNRNRGNSIEREVAAKLGLRRVGHEPLRGREVHGRVGEHAPGRLRSGTGAPRPGRSMTELLTYSEAAKRLRISQRTLERLIASGRIRPISTSPGRRAIEEREVQAYLAAQRRAA
jgi:excisionase family DNA binding protein